MKNSASIASLILAPLKQIQWDADLVFKVGGRMFAVAATEPSAKHRLSFECGDETRAGPEIDG